VASNVVVASGGVRMLALNATMVWVVWVVWMVWMVWMVWVVWMVWMMLDDVR
jgi:hypothetical protein